MSVQEKLMNEWIIKFKTNIKTKNGRDNLFLIIPELLHSKRSMNLNAKILNNDKEIEEKRQFYIINNDIWQIIKKENPNEKEIKIEGRYDNKKYIFLINQFIYYFYCVNEKDELKEGYFRFQEEMDGKIIINEFINESIEQFINKYHIKSSKDLQTIKYKTTYFLFQFKSGFKENIINNNNINRNIINNINNKKNVKKEFNNNFQNNNNFNIFPIQNVFNHGGHLNNNNIQNNQININNIINNNKFNFPKSKNVFNNNNITGNNLNIINNNFINQKKPRNHSANNRKIIIKEKIHIPKNCTAGLDNIGATCYMNATLQCLAHVNKLTKYLLKAEHMQNILQNKSKFRLTNAYLTVLINLWKNVNIKNYAPHQFKQVISNMNPLFQGIQANDSKDLILFLLETIHTELNKPIINAQKINGIINQYDFYQTFKIFKKYFINNFRSVISNLFYGFFDSVMICKNCNSKSKNIIKTHNIQCYNILIFPLEEVRIYKKRPQNIVSIEECFEYYQKKETMSGQNQIYCNNCKSVSDSTNYTKLLTSPNVLVLNLNRGKGLQFNIQIEFEEYLDIQKFLFFSNLNEVPSFYECIGIVTHFGPSSMSGHFIAFCKSFVDKNWYKYNDSIVSLSSFNEAKNTGVPYILFYSTFQSK